MELAATQTVPQGKDTAIKSEPYMSFELSGTLWPFAEFIEKS